MLIYRPWMCTMIACCACRASEPMEAEATLTQMCGAFLPGFGTLLPSQLPYPALTQRQHYLETLEAST